MTWDTLHSLMDTLASSHQSFLSLMNQYIHILQSLKTSWLQICQTVLRFHKNFLYKFDTGTYSSPMHELIIDLDLIEMNPPCFCVYSVQLSPPVCLCTQTFQWSPDKLDVFITAISYPNSHKIIDSPYTSIRPRGQFKPRYKGHRGYLLSPGKRPKLGRES